MKCLVLVLDTSWKGEYPAMVQALKESGYEVDTGILAPDATANYKYEFVYAGPEMENVVQNYDAVAVVGGYRMYYIVCGKKFPTRRLEVPRLNVQALEVALKTAMSSNKLIIAPLAVPAYLAKLGLIRGRKATVYPTTDLIRMLIENGVEFVNEDIVRDGNLITMKKMNVEELKKKLSSTSSE
ncbi:MAG: DJ-1/PfpI family protein [Crenarchaeota archaeon]|nr:DJ-1/PfpI family protein [Thermoproteota archaeon]